MKGECRTGLGELTKVWLTVQHSCLIRESVPVKVPKQWSDIDTLAMRADLRKFRLPQPVGQSVGPRLVVEIKDEHDFDPDGTNFADRLRDDFEHMDWDWGYIPANTPGVNFKMLLKNHFAVAQQFFGSDDFDRVFVVHNLNRDRDGLQDMLAALERKRIFFVTAQEIWQDWLEWYHHADDAAHAALRATLMGDTLRLLHYLNVFQVNPLDP